MMRTGLVTIELNRDAWVAAKTVGFMAQRDFEHFKEQCRKFGVRYDPSSKLRTVERASAGALAGYLRAAGFSVKMARSLEDHGTAGALTLGDLIELARPIFKCAVDKHILDFAAMGPSALAGVQLQLLRPAEIAAAKVLAIAEPGYPAIAEEAEQLLKHLRAALAAREQPGPEGGALPPERPPSPAPPSGPPLTEASL